MLRHFPPPERLRILLGIEGGKAPRLEASRLQSTGLFLSPELYSPVHDLIPRRHRPTPGNTL